MARPKTECPNCNSPQSFPRRFKTGVLPIRGVKEIYISCTNCIYTAHVGWTTDAIESTIRATRKLARSMDVQMQRHGAVNQATEAAWRTMSDRRSKLQRELYEQISAIKEGRDAA
jgi:hypothetical protein